MSKSRQDRNINIPDQILRQLLTSSEWRMLKNRFQIINLLANGLSIRKIAAEVKVGTDTVVRVIRMMEKNNSLGQLNKGKSKIKSQTPWIFGKSND